jgi:hypothetical protein
MNMMKKIILFFAIYLIAAIAAQAKCNLGIKFEESASKNSLFQIPIKPEVKSNHPILDHPNAWRQAYFIQKAKEVCPGQNMGDVEIKYIFNDKKLSAVIFKKINTASKKNKNNNLFFNYVKENYPLKIDSDKKNKRISEKLRMGNKTIFYTRHPHGNYYAEELFIEGSNFIVY